MFFITCFTKVSIDELGYPDIGSSRTVGFVDTLEEAGELLLNNACDFWETIYEYAIIEEIHSGIYPVPEDRCFFQFDMDRQGYRPIEEPKELERVAIFAF